MKGAALRDWILENLPASLGALSARAKWAGWGNDRSWRAIDSGLQTLRKRGTIDWRRENKENIWYRKEAGGPSVARVLDQNDIDSLLGFNQPEGVAVPLRASLLVGKPSIVAHLRATKCDLQKDAADLLEFIATWLKSRFPNDDEAKSVVWNIEKGRLYD